MVSGLRHVRAPPSARLPASNPLSVAIIGNDMLLAALPATPVQLAHACYQVGYQIVVPASWGDELIAHAVLEDLRERERDPVIQCTCPIVAERLLANGEHLVPAMVRTAAPPVAAARYARHAFSPRAIRVTYMGACPGARDPAIDQRYLPDEFLQLLVDQGVMVADMPTVFDSVLPPDRRRFVSLPGGCPTQEALWQATEGRMLREVTQQSFSADLAQTLVWREHVIIDVAPALGCACAGTCSRLGAQSGRVAVMAIEPPRASQPVVAFQPEFTAVEPPIPAESSNGDVPRTLGPSPRAEHLADATSSGPGTARPGVQATPIVSRVRARDRAEGSLPRAYLAKRRHLGPAGRSSTPQPQAEQVPAHEGIGAAAIVPPEPNDASDVGLPIAIHVEPEPGRGRAQEQTADDTTRGEAFVAPESSSALVHEQAMSAPLDGVRDAAPRESFAPPPRPSTPEPGTDAAPREAHLAETEGVSTVTMPTPETEREEEEEEEEEEWAAPVPEALTEPTPTFETPSGPLRVEVEIFDEGDVADVEVVIPDAVHSDEHLKPPHPVPEVVTRPMRPWGDFLIAVWLVLVASAVIAALLWRR